MVLNMFSFIKRQIKNKIKNIKQGFPSEECFSLDYTFIKWLNKRLVVYLEEASKVVDLTFYKFEYDNKTYTQEEVIVEMINLTNKIINDDNYFFGDDNSSRDADKLLDLFKLVFHHLWW